MPRPQSNDMYVYRVRIDGEFDYDKITRFSNLVSNRYILVNHVLPHGNPHYHYYIETRYSQGNFSTKIKEEFGVKGGEYCVQKCDLDRTIEYCSYMFNVKNGNVATLISFCGFSALDIATYRENSKLIEKEFKTKMATGKKTQFDIVQIVLQRHDPKVAFLPEVLYDEVISVLKETRTMARPYHVRDIISSVMSFSNDKSARQQIKDVTLKFFSSL